MVFYVKAEFGKIHTTLFPGAKELIGSVKCAPTSCFYGRLATPIPLTSSPIIPSTQDLKMKKEAIFSTPSAKLSENLDHMKERRGRFWAINTWFPMQVALRHAVSNLTIIRNTRRRKQNLGIRDEKMGLTAIKALTTHTSYPWYNIVRGFCCQ